MIKNNELERIKFKIIPTLKEYRVTKAGIFGSYARGKQKKNSDIDILINIEDGADLIELISLREKLQNLTKRKVDLVDYSSIRKEFKKSILNEEIKII